MPLVDCPVLEFLFILIPLDAPITTRSKLAPPKHLSLEMASAHVRHETARGVVFSEVKLAKLDHHFDAGSGIPNRGRRQAMGQKALAFYAALQRELLDPVNGNQIERKLPQRLKPTRTTNVHECQGDTEHAINGEGARYLSKASVEASQS